MSQLENLVFYSIIRCFVLLCLLLFLPLSSPLSFPLLSPFPSTFISVPSPLPAHPLIYPHHLLPLFSITSSRAISVDNFSQLLFLLPSSASLSFSLLSPVLLSLLSPPLICSPGSGPAKLPVLQSDGDRVQNLITHWLTARTTC